MSSVLTQPTEESYESMGKWFYQIFDDWLARSVMDDMTSVLDFLSSVEDKMICFVLSWHSFQYIVPVNGLLSSLLKPLDSFVCGKILKLKYNLHSHSYSYAALVSLQWHQTYLVQQSLKNFLWKRATRTFFHWRKSVIQVWKNMKVNK